MSAPVARPRRRRRGLGLLITLVVLGVLLVVADRLTLGFAEKAVADRLAGQAPFTTAPTVKAAGFPFLTQAVGGTYRDVTVSGSGLTLGQLQGVGFDADLHGVHVPLSSVVKRSVDRIPIDTAQGTVVIPYAEFARLTSIDGLTITESGGRLTVAAPVKVDVAFVHETFDVVADGRVALVGQDLQLRVENIRVAGVSLPSVAVNAASDLLNSKVTLPSLPYGLQLTSVEAQGDGLHVAAAGRDLTIAAG